ncbi:E3 ubiquitin-protein ligase RNF216-like [Cylas formicarius]|uniref:E3 ubiquitin-protein ligase RNF216-like n=1 Tax=Cylas formicarius TaxID=197179 RepID=UPI002958C940|nr:E3 ubiquitin-protein ligase RNF216-like [Cylas formicarius]XP_060535264.1 E3 ubiquitin-protein ligase RNF216-like [Cylas formicarius]
MDSGTVKPFLREMFPNASDRVIDFVMQVVEEQNPWDSPDEKIENMVNLMSGQLEDDNPCSTLNSFPVSDSVPMRFGNHSGHDRALNANYNHLINIFGDADPDFLWDYCQSKQSRFNMDDAIDYLTQADYKKRDKDPLVIFNRLQEALPGADPSYLEKEAERLALLGSAELEQFVSDAIENNSYPTMEDYLKQKKDNEALNFYTDQFDPELFLELFPNPEMTFRQPTRKSFFSDELGGNEGDVNCAKIFLYNMYPFIRKRHIDLVFARKKDRLIECCDVLDTIRKGLRNKRSMEVELKTTNLPLLQEMAYLKHRRMIKRFIKYKDDTYRQCKEEARKLNILETCRVCYDDELIPEECFVCGAGCIFCKDCVQKGVETRIADGHLTFPCFEDCGSEFGLNRLQMVLPKKTFERLVLRVQSEEIKRAKIEGLETCPFCDFAAIPVEGSTVFQCENPDCGKESCRQCGHESHIPARCSEVEYDEDVRRRTFIEDKMTEALTRTCYSCQKKFIKSTGCNKMTCPCGAMMCYLCSLPITAYSHFGLGGCALFTNDSQVNLSRVKETAAKAKQELGNVEVKFDPTVGILSLFSSAIRI